MSSTIKKFPVENLQIVVEPGGYGPNAVVMGYVSRGENPAVHLLINERKHKIFANDSILIHELSHLLLPKVNMDEPWLTEGLATYYEHLLLARGKIKSSSEIIKLFAIKFELARQSGENQPLAQISPTRSFSFGRDQVYWGGASIFFVADVNLRKKTNGLMSLDTILMKFMDCCAKNRTSWSALELFEVFDQLSGFSIFLDLYKSYVLANVFPPVKKSFRSLGYRISGQGNNTKVSVHDGQKLNIF